MKKELSDNELIAEFMGWERYGNAYKCPNLYPIENSTNSGWTTFAHETFEFHTRWDSLMPVVHKIGELYNRAFPSKEKFIELILSKQDPIDSHYIDVISISIASPISEVYAAVINFIHWYNTQKGL